MKKHIALILIVLLMFAMFASVPVAAEEAEPPTQDEELSEETATTSDEIVAWIMENLEEISVICTLLLTVWYQARKHIVLNKSITTMNNNSISVAEKSDTSIKQALLGIEGASETVSSYVDAMNKLLAEVRSNNEDKQKLVAKLDEVTRFLETAKRANVELSNELAELLVLANIPNSKKEELYSRHRAAIDALVAAEKERVMEVKEDVEDEKGA